MIENKITLEKRIIGQILMYPKNLDTCYLYPKPEYFSEIRKDLMKDIISFHFNQKPVSILTLSQYNNKYSFECVDCTKRVGADIDFNYYLQQLIEMFADTEFQKYYFGLSEKLVTNHAFDLFEGVRTKMDELENHVITTKSKEKFGEKVKKRIAEIKNIPYQETIPYIQTGFSGLDSDLNGGIKFSKLILLAGRPSMGKTAFALQLGRNIAKSKRVTYYSLEMEEEELIDREILNASGVNQIDYNKGELDELQVEKLNEAIEKIGNSNFTIYDNIYNIHEIERSIKKDMPDVVFIDHLGWIKGYDEFQQNIRLGKITKDLKRICKQTKIPIILLCQLNRSLSTRPEKRPELSDLRESGQIEEDIDICLFIHREDYYHRYENLYLKTNKTEILNAKHRGGALFKRYFRNNETISEFTEMTEIYSNGDYQTQEERNEDLNGWVMNSKNSNNTDQPPF